MKKTATVSLVVLLSLFTLIVSANAAEEEKVVINQSPFGEASFMLYSGAHASGSAAHKGAKDAKYGYDTPQGGVEIIFNTVIHEIDAKNEGLSWDYGVQLSWSGVEIQVNPEIKGMAISYERKTYMNPKKVILFVPDEKAKEMWNIKAGLFLAEYTKAFWETKKEVKEEKEKAARERTAHLENLRKGAIMVYPIN